MAKIDFGAPIIRAALASLEADFAAHVAAFNAETENLVDLVVPIASVAGYGSGGGYVFGAEPELVNFPLVEAAIIAGTMGPFSTGSAGVGDSDHTPRLQITLWQMGETGEVPALYEASLGYARCVIEILSEDGKLGPTAEVAGGRADAISYQALEPIVANPEQENRQFRKWRVPIVVSFVVEAVETWH